MALVTRSGKRFLLNGQRFRFIGVNNYPLIQNHYTVAQLDSFFRYCVDNNIKIVRTWCFDRTPYNGGSSGNVSGNFQYITGSVMSWREATFAQLDLVLDRARANGIKLSLVMSNGANEFTNDGCKQSYCRWNNTINGTSHGAYNYGDAFHTDTNIRARFKEFLVAVYNRTNTVNGRVYKDDDTIAFIELMNEARYRNEGGSESNIGTLNSSFVQALKAWYYEMADYLKNTIGVQQLVSSGGAGQYYDYVRGDPVHNNSTYGLDFQLDHTPQDFDYCDFHIYPYSDSTYYMTSYGAKAISSISKAVTMAASGTSITVTLTNHGFSVGQVVNIFDSNQTGYDGNRIVATTPTDNTFTFTAGSAPSVTTASGYCRTITLAGFKATLQEYANVAHNNLKRPIVCGEYGLVKANTMTTNPLNSFPKAANHEDLFKIIFDEFDYDGIFLWHFTNLFDDSNFNIKPDGPHTGGNANSNANDSDFHLLQVIAGRNARFKIQNRYATNNNIKFYRIKYVKKKKKA